jgi:hypothetical protein
MNQYLVFAEGGKQHRIDATEVKVSNDVVYFFNNNATVGIIPLSKLVYAINEKSFDQARG